MDRMSRIPDFANIAYENTVRAAPAGGDSVDDTSGPPADKDAV